MAGQCTAAGSPVTAHGGCINQGDACAGYCNGAPSCVYPGGSTSCAGTSSCQNGTLSTTSGSCNAGGTCVQSGSMPGSCGGFPCASSAGCATSCTAGYQDGCLPGFTCLGGTQCIPSTTTCGDGPGPTCAMGQGGMCCLTWNSSNTAASGQCLPVGASSCTTDDSVDPYIYRDGLTCTKTADCASGNICCHTSVYIASSSACQPTATCVDDHSGFYTRYRLQLCDPANPGCVTGSCTGTISTGINYCK
jgi:hypothetical protein